MRANKEVTANVLRERPPGYRKAYYAINRDKILAQNKALYEKTDPEILRERWRRKRRTLQTRIADGLRTRLWIALNKARSGGPKAGSAIGDLGCSMKFLKMYLELQFYAGMTWDNYGKYWEIDHIRPLASFDLADRNQFMEACCFINLQPLTKRDNAAKGARLIGISLNYRFISPLIVVFEGTRKNDFASRSDENCHGNRAENPPGQAIRAHRGRAGCPGSITAAAVAFGDCPMRMLSRESSWKPLWHKWTIPIRKLKEVISAEINACGKIPDKLKGTR